MTGILTHPEKGSAGLQLNSLASLGQAVSPETRELAKRIQALQVNPSPASLRPGAATIGQKPLQERLFNALASAKVLTSQVAMHLDGAWRRRIFSQLDSIHDLEELEVGDEPLQQSSFATFLKAILDINPERRPGLGLSHVGHLIASWATGQDYLTIEFLPNDRVRWVLSRRYDEDDTERFAGDTAVARLRDGLANFHPDHWFSHGPTNHEST
jgi:hypothetical protein